MKELEESKKPFPNKNTLLIFDGDLIVYQKGFKHEKTEDWDVVERDIDMWIADFFKKFGTYNYIIYLTGKGNFRETVAVTHKYKGDRIKPKPRWYRDIVNYLTHIHITDKVEGYEADDAIAIHMTKEPNSIHIGIDKDINMVQGWHYRYATHNSPEVPLRYISQEGFLEIQLKGKNSIKKLVGGGTPWFYAQMLMGDSTDYIFAIKGYGDLRSYDILKDCKDEASHLQAVIAVYKEGFGDIWRERLLENADLLWMVTNFNESGELEKWSKMNSHRIK